MFTCVKCQLIDKNRAHGRLFHASFCGSLFEECPKAKLLFGFPLDMDPSCDTLRKSRRFTTHAKYMIEMLDRSIGLLGPDAELLAEILIERKWQHTVMV